MTDQPLTPDELAKIERRCSRAMCGPWEHRGGPIVAGVPSAPVRYIVADRAYHENGEFIAHARTDVPRLLAEVKRLRGALRASHLSVCTADNCVLDGGPEHEGAFSGSDA